MLCSGNHKMIKWYSWIIFITLGVFAQDVSYRNIESELQDCYDRKYLHEKDNRLPHTLSTFIALIRKIENAGDLNLDLRTIAVGIIHRFRQDGVVENPAISSRPGVSPYAPLLEQAAKFTRTLSFIPQKTAEIPFDVLTDVERCTLHFMLSDSIEIFKRGDESLTCKVTDNAYRRPRSAKNNLSTKENLNLHDVETLTPEQIDVITNHKDTEDAIDPNALYPELPPNHPKAARVLSLPPYSDCPVENGIVKTNWGPVSIGSVIAGLAAGLQPETVRLSDWFPAREVAKRPILQDVWVDNKWIATISGDLAEVALIQGPMKQKLKIGANGNWNSSSLPHWYFLKHNDTLEFTTAEVRGDIDGLMLANEIESLYSKIPTLKLSQILELYYGAHGLFDRSIRACNRGTLFQAIASSNSSKEMDMQAFGASLVLQEDLQIATIDDSMIKEFAQKAAEALSTSVASLVDGDLSCKNTETGDFQDTVQMSADLTIILDTTWPFDLIQPILMNLLDNMKINEYNTQYTIINAHDGNVTINTTDTILTFASYNATNYGNVTGNFDLAKSLDKLESIQTEKLNNERSSLGGAKSDIVLIVPYTSTVPDPDKEYCLQRIQRMRERVPDATLLVLTYGSRDRWTEYVNNPTTDTFSSGMGEKEDGALSTVLDLISRIRKVPQRLINTKCGADYSPVGSTNAFYGYIQPNTAVSYRMHPNYFYSSDSSHYSTIKIEPSVWGVLKACTSRTPININSSNDENVKCTQISDKAHTVSFSCNEAEYIHSCQSFYLSIFANSTVDSYPCQDIQFCRFANMIKYTISYENLVCVSSASANLVNIAVLIISIIYMFL